MARRRNTVVPQQKSVLTESSRSVHEEMFRTLLQTPHRESDETLAMHRAQFDRDPNFYGRLGVYAVGQGHCVIRDINEIFLAVLFASSFKEHKDAAYVMLQSLDPYQVQRVCQYFTGRDEFRKHWSYDAPIPDGQFGITVTDVKYSQRHHDPEKRGKTIPVQTVAISPMVRKKLLERKAISPSTKNAQLSTLIVKHAYLGQRRVKGALRDAVQAYLRIREQNPKQMEGALLRQKNAMHYLYARSQILPQNDPDGWVNQFLFHNKAKEGSRLHALQKLSKCTEPSDQAKIILEAKIPFQMATSAIKAITPTVLVALIEVMTPQELLQSMSALQRYGAMDNADVKALIDGKLKKAKTSKGRIDALKAASAAASATGLSEETRKTMVEITDTQLKRHGQIRAKTLLAIDKSGSMESAIELGKHIGASIAQSCVNGNPPITYLFDTMATPVEWKASDGDITKKSSWDKKFQMFRANGGTAPETIIRALMARDVILEQIVLVTDEGENNSGQFADRMKEYKAKFGISPSVVIVRVGTSCNSMENTLKKAGIEVEVMECPKIDDVAIPNLIQLLSKKSVFDLVQDILQIDLPTKEQWCAQNNVTRLGRTKNAS